MKIYHQIFTLLRQASDLSPLNQLTQLEWQQLYDIATEQHIAPLIYTQIKSKQISIPAEIKAKFHHSYLQNSARNMSIYHAFRQLSAQLQKQNIPLIPLKGIYLAEAIYSTIGERVIGDMDLLIPKKHIAQAIDLAIACDYLPDRPVQLEAWLAQKHHVCPQYHTTSRLALEWHWHIMPPSYDWPIDSLWQRATPATLSHQPIFALAVEDLLLHLAYHLSHHHDFLFGLRNLCDLAQVCRIYEDRVEWERVFQQAKVWGVVRGVYLALLMAKQHLAAPIPDPLLEQYQPAGFAPKHLTLATAQIFVNPQQVQQLSLTRRRTMGVHGFGNKMRAFWAAIFPSAERLALRYGMNPHTTPWLNLYGVRWLSLARQAKAKMEQGSQNTAVSTILKRQRQLSAWLQSTD